MGNSSSTNVKWDPEIRTGYDIWPNIVDYYERHKAEGCNLEYLMSPLRAKIERHIEERDENGMSRLMKPAKQPKIIGHERIKRLKEMRRAWMVHAGVSYQEADLSLNLEPPKLIVDQYRDFKHQGRDLDYVDPVLRAYFEEKLAVRNKEDHHDGFPALNSPAGTAHGHRFGKFGVRSLGRKPKPSEWPWPEGWSGGRPLSVPWWMTGDVSSWETPLGQKRSTVGRRKRLRDSVLSRWVDKKEGKEVEGKRNADV